MITHRERDFQRILGIPRDESWRVNAIRMHPDQAIAVGLCTG